MPNLLHTSSIIITTTLQRSYNYLPFFSGKTWGKRDKQSHLKSHSGCGSERAESCTLTHRLRSTNLSSAGMQRTFTDQRLRGRGLACVLRAGAFSWPCPPCPFTGFSPLPSASPRRAPQAGPWAPCWPAEASSLASCLPKRT